MRVLAVDTSSERGSVCIADGGEILGEIRLSSSVQHSERLFSCIEFLLKQAPFRLADIDLFVASRGPGSFTGLRVGLAAMEGFAAAHQKPSAGISSLAAVAWKTGISDELIAPTIDARRGEVYGALYRRVGDQLVEERAGIVMPPADWFASLPGEGGYVCGDGAEKHREFLKTPAWKVHRMDLYLAGTIAELAETSNRGPLEPLYVRKTDAEVQRERREHHESVAGPNPKG
jgi:tRNA threonylcarbamoyladenosine biosynthesis protein TsaB